MKKFHIHLKSPGNKYYLNKIMLVVNLSLNMSNVNLSVLEFQIQTRILKNGNSHTHQKNL
jgi:hypothetical protein